MEVRVGSSKIVLNASEAACQFLSVQWIVSFPSQAVRFKCAMQFSDETLEMLRVLWIPWIAEYHLLLKILYDPGKEKAKITDRSRKMALSAGVSSRFFLCFV
jgi:hypothetical protein